MGENSSEPWHLDRRVPIALIFTLLAQTAGMLWWAANLNRTVEEHGRRIASVEQADIGAAIEARRVSENLARLDERLAAQTNILRRIDEWMQRGGRPPAGFP
jgi:hypothetical protein